MKLSILIPVWNQEELIIRALDSIPRREDVEVLVRDDGSTDNTLKVVREYKKTHPELNLSVFFNKQNRGCAYTMNRLVKKATGEYFSGLGSDDCLDTYAYNKVIDLAGDADVVCMNIKITDGSVWKVTPETDRLYCGMSVRLVRKSIADGITFPEHVKAGSDWYFHEELIKRNPKTIYTNITAYNYNFPRKDSIVDLRRRGMIKEV